MSCIPDSTVCSCSCHRTGAKHVMPCCNQNTRDLKEIKKYLDDWCTSDETIEENVFTDRDPGDETDEEPSRVDKIAMVKGLMERALQAYEDKATREAYCTAPHVEQQCERCGWTKE